MVGPCRCGNLYLCPRCDSCYYCRHKVVRGEWESISVGWRCPDRFVKPAYGPSSPLFQVWKEEE
jgi:hypothetical protein